MVDDDDFWHVINVAARRGAATSQRVRSRQGRVTAAPLVAFAHRSKSFSLAISASTSGWNRAVVKSLRFSQDRFSYE